MASGLDTTADCSSQASCIAENYAFVLRYYAPLENPYEYKVMTRSEAVALSQAGLQIGVVWETNPVLTSYFSNAQGQSDATSAVTYAHNTIVQPENSAIYFSVDYDATESDAQGAIADYFEGVSTAINQLATEGYPYYAPAVYGDGAVCEYLKSQGLVSYTWLAGAASWPGSGSYTGWNLKQGSSGITVCTIGFDPDTSSSDFGEFTV